MRKLYKSALFATTALSFGLTLPPAAKAAGVQSGDAAPIEEVVVTARRVEERLLTVPISITVYNQEQLTARNISSGADLASFTPSLSANIQFGSENTGYSLRGFGQDLQTTPSVGVYFGDVVAPRGGFVERSGDGAGPGDFFDLQNVQVLKGPQGTLFGRNTTGGAILLVPKKPTPDYEGYFEAGGGNYGMEHLQGALNLPLGDKVRLRMGFDQQKRDGYLNNISGIGPSDFNNTDYIAGRVSLVVDVTDDLENYTIGRVTHSATHGPIEQVFACNPKQTLFGQMSCDQVARDQGHGPYAVDNFLPNANSSLQLWQVINTTTWQATDDLTIKNVASYAELQSDLSSTLFGVNWTIPSAFTGLPGIGQIPTGKYAGTVIPFTDTSSPPGFSLANQMTFSEELQVQARLFDDKLKWQGGLYLEGSHTMADAGIRSATFIPCSNVDAFQCDDVMRKIFFNEFHHAYYFTNAGAQQQTGRLEYRNLGVYTQADYNLTDELKLEAGIRFTQDTNTAEANRFVYKFPPFAPGEAPISCFSTTATVANNCAQAFHKSSSAPTWVVDIEYNPDPDFMTYAKYSRGYRQGSIIVTGADNYNSFQPEQVDTYELGAKTSFHGDISGTLNAAAFYNNFSDQQIEVGFLSNKVAPTNGILNAGKSRIWGLELDTTVVPYKGLTLNFAYTYLNSKVTALTIPPDCPTCLYNSVSASTAPGEPLPLTPRNKGTFTATYTLPLEESLGKVSVGATYVYTGSQIVLASGPYAYVPSFDVLNLNLDWESIAGSPIDAEFFMTNVTGNFYATYVNDFETATVPLGFASRNLGEPRMYGARLRYRFNAESSTPESAAPYTPPPAVAPAPAVAHSYMVFFDFDKSDLSSDAVAIVDQAAKNAGPAKATELTVTGHTDTVGSDAYNMRLSKRRAESVAAQLEKDGIPASEIALVAKGKRDLLVPTKDGVKEPQNRRVTIVYSGGPTS